LCGDRRSAHLLSAGVVDGLERLEDALLGEVERLAALADGEELVGAVLGARDVVVVLGRLGLLLLLGRLVGGLVRGGVGTRVLLGVLAGQTAGDGQQSALPCCFGVPRLRGEQTHLLVGVEVVLELLLGLLDLLLHRVERLGVRLARLLGRRLLGLDRGVDVVGQSREERKELGREEDGRARQG
jgi:hypothetical protein